MNCTDFHRWFLRLLREDAPPDFPADAYRMHVLQCERCRLRLSLPEVTEKLADRAAALPARLSPERTAALVAGARRRARRTVRIRWLGRVAAALVVAAGLFAFRLRDRSEEPDVARESSSGAAASAAAPAEAERPPPPPLAEIARGLQTPGFELDAARQAHFDRNLLLLYRWTDETADPYAFGRHVALSDCASLYPDAPLLTVTVVDGKKKVVFRVQFPTDELAAKRDDPELRRLSAYDFCHTFKVLAERPDLSKYRGE